MRIVVWAMWLALFILFFSFALNNTAHTELYFFPGWIWQAPLIALLLAFFFGGVVFGFLAMLPVWLRLRVEIRRLKKLHAQEAQLNPTGAATTGSTTIQTVAQSARTTS